MQNKTYTIDDLLEFLAGFKGPYKIDIEKADATIMYSIARQVFKGVALTDRQFALMQEKLLNYRTQFVSHNIDFDNAINNTRYPLRQIDRSKYIKIVDTIEQTSDKGPFIKIRFPFKKSDIMLINEISSIDNYFHSKGSHEHFFLLNEKNVYNIVDRFKDKEFNIDEELLDYYKKIVGIIERKKDFICGIYDNELLNLNPKVKDIALKEIGEFNNSTKILYIDRKLRYGINHVDDLPNNTLTDKIAFRSNAFYQSKPDNEPISDLLKAMWDLQRLPMLVILESSNPEEQIYSILNYYRDILPTESQSVLFRQDGESEFNQLIKDRKLNNWVDKDTKIVYISNDKLPKLMLNTDWSPDTTLSFTSSLHRSVDYYVRKKGDLIIFREEHISTIRRYSKYYG